MNNTSIGSSRDDGLQLLQFRLYAGLISCCFLAVILNCYILLSTAFLTSKKSPNVKLCISLCAADTCAAADHSMMLLLLLIRVRVHACAVLAMLLFTWASTANCILHVVAIAGTQLLGVWFPIQSRYWLSGRFVRFLILAMWILPITTYAFGVYLYQAAKDMTMCSFNAFYYVKFRTLQTCIVVPAFVVTLIVYAYMLFLVNKRDNQDMKHELRSSRKQHSWAQRKQAVITAVLIASSLGVGYLPLTVVNQTFCHRGCIYNPSHFPDVTMIVTSSTYVLTILKLSANAFIYVSRIPAIRASIARMNAFILHRKTVGNIGHFSQSSQQASLRSSVRRASRKSFRHPLQHVLDSEIYRRGSALSLTNANFSMQDHLQLAVADAVASQAVIQPLIQPRRVRITDV